MIPEPIPTRTHAPVSQRALSMVVWLLIVVVGAAFISMLLLGGVYALSWASGLFGGAR